MSNYKENNEYLSFGNLPLYKCQVESVDGYLSIDISGSIKIKDDYIESGLTNIADNVNTKLKLNFNTSDFERFISLGFTFQDILVVFNELNRSQQKIIESFKIDISKEPNGDEKSFRLNFDLSYCEFSLKFLNINGVAKIQFLLQDKYDPEKNISFFINYHDYKYITAVFNYFIQNFININNMLLNKYYNQSIVNFIYNTSKQIKSILDYSKDVESKFDNIVNSFGKSVNLLVNNISKGVKLDINKKPEGQLLLEKNDKKDVTDDIKEESKEEVENEELIIFDCYNVSDHIEYDTKEEEDNSSNISKDISNSSNISKDISNSSKINEDVSNSSKINEDISNSSIYDKEEQKIYPDNGENFNIKDVFDDEDEYDDMHDEFDVFMNDNMDVIKERTLIEISDKDYEPQNEEIKEKNEIAKTLNNFDFKNTFKMADVIRTNVNYSFLAYSTFNDVNLSVFGEKYGKKINEIFDDIVINKDIIRIFFNVGKFYQAYATINGFRFMSDPTYPVEIKTDSIKNNNEILKLMSFLFVNLCHFNDLKDILVKNNVDPYAGNKDDRKVTSLFKILYSSILTGYFINEGFNKDKFLDTCLKIVDKDYFDSDVVIKQLDKLGIVNISNKYDYKFYENNLNKLIMISKKIVNDFEDFKGEFLYKVVMKNYEFNEDIIEKIIKYSNEEIMEKVNETNFINPIILQIIDSKDLTNNKLVEIIKSIKSDYSDVVIHENFDKINWNELEEKTLQAIITYQPLKDPRLRSDLNYFLKKLQDCQYNKKECIDLLYGCKNEQKIVDDKFIY